MQAFLEQFLYGSTPHSAGYSLLAKSGGLSQVLLDEAISYCENYDEQRVVAPVSPYSISLYRRSPEDWILLEIFGHWKDQVGRPSKVMRNTLIPSPTWAILDGNPFLLLWLFPPLRRFLPKKRNQTIEIPAFSAEHFLSMRPAFWERETQTFFKIFSSLSPQEKSYIPWLQQAASPFSPQEIPVEKESFSLCRALLYALAKEKRVSCEMDSFSLNSRTPRGLTFRYLPYCQKKKVEASSEKFSWELASSISTIVKSAPEGINFQILQKLYKKKIFIHYIFLILFALFFLVGCWLIFGF